MAKREYKLTGVELDISESCHESKEAARAHGWSMLAHSGIRYVGAIWEDTAGDAEELVVTIAFDADDEPEEFTAARICPV